MIPWSRLDHKIFEELAYRYATDEYPNYDWKTTPSSGDGNKDAYAVSNVTALDVDFEYQHWIEAKYNKKGTRLSKGQLDPTLVSGLIAQNVRIIMFVTNGYIPDSYILRAKLAYTRDNRRAVLFRDRDDLEQWLCSSRRLQAEFFGPLFSIDPDRSLTTSIQNVTILRWHDLRKSIYQPVRILDNTEDYLLHIIVRSHEEQEIRIVVSEDSQFAITPSSVFPVSEIAHKGLNSYCLLFKPLNQDQESSGSIAIHDRNDRIVAKRSLPNVSVEYRYKPNITFSQQLSIITELFNRITTYKYIDNAVISIFAHAGIGKSYLLDRVEDEFSTSTDLVRFNFTDSSAYNARIICELILFLQFGYSYRELDDISWDLVGRDARNIRFFDDKFLTKLKSGSKDTASALEVISYIASNTSSLLLVSPTATGLPRIAILDDVHKLSGEVAEVAEVATKLLRDHFSGNNSSLICLGARRTGFHSNLLKDTINDTSTVTHELLSPTVEDIETTLQEALDLRSVSRITSTIGNLELSTLELLVLCLHSNSLKNKIGSEPRRAVYAHRLVDELVTKGSKIVRDRLVTNKECFQILDVIMALPIGIDRALLAEQNDSKLIQHLIDESIVGLDQDERLVPFHDIIREEYLKLRGNVYTKNVGSVVAQWLQYDRNMALYLLPVLIKCGPSYASEYLKESIQLRDRFIETTQFNSAFLLAESIASFISNYSGEHKRLSPVETVESYFVLACTSSDKSDILV